MQFRREFYQEQINTRKTKIEEFEAKLLKPISKEETLLWEVGTALETLNYVSACLQADRSYLAVQLKRKIVINELEELYETIEEVLWDFAFNSASTEKDIYYKHKDGTSINIYLNPASCKSIPTGKMVPEMKSDCGFVKTS